MLRIRRITAGMGGVNYLLRAAGCAEHDHLRDSREATSSGAEYLLGSAEQGEPDGVWHGKGMGMLGLEAGQHVTAEQMRAVYGRLEHCAEGREGESLGRRPRNYESVEVRLAAALAAEPNASEERIEEIHRQVKASKMSAVGFYDLNTSTTKSVGLLEKALRVAGEHAKADAVVAAHNTATAEMLDYMESQVTTTRVGYHRTVTREDGTRVTLGEYAKITGFVVTMWQHSSSRDGDPHIHTHAAVLNRVMTEDGRILALDAQQFAALKGSGSVVYERRVEELVTEATGARFGWRPDGQAREILGLDRDLCEESSSRSAVIKERLAELVNGYVAEHGHKAGRQAMQEMRNAAWNEARTAKSLLSPEAVSERYVRKVGEQRLIDQVAQVSAAAEKAAAEDKVPAGQPRFESEDEMLREAVKRTQELYATWDETALAMEINKLVGDVQWGASASTEIDRMIARAVSPDGPAAVVVLAGRERVRAPQALRQDNQADGAPVYRAANSLRYATRDQVSAEKQLVAEAHLDAGPQVEAEHAQDLRAQLAAGGLSGDQLNAVMGVLTSGKAADVLIGPAGTGKSRTVGELDRVWRAQFGAPVLGLATSQRATDVLTGEGLEALNTSQFLTRYLPEDGREPTETLVTGTMIVVDEAGMADTDKLAKIAQLVRKAGGKLLYTGDHEQLAAVGTGGLLRLLTRDASPFELAKVHRFHAEWEREASLKFREGDPAALDEYERRGRLRGGTKEAMGAAAVRGYLADVLAGRDSVLVTKTNGDAADLSSRVRMELQALGRVAAEDLAHLDDDTACGVGDLIAARLNDHNVSSANGEMLVNREILTVIGKDGRDYLVAERKADGTKVWLSPTYVAEHVSLAYAGTVHSVQGRTTDTSHSLVERGMSRNSAYVEATRGRAANYLYAVTKVTGDEHDPEAYSMSAADVLREVLDTDGAQVSAVETYRAALESADSLEQIGAVWSLAAREAMTYRHHDLLLGLLGSSATQWVVDDDGHARLMATLQHAELSGHDVERVLTTAIGDEHRSLTDAKSMAAVIRSRVQRIVDAEGDRPVPGRWSNRLRSAAGTISEYAQDLGKLMDERVEMMARAAIIAPPDWALVQLGAVPAEADMTARTAWAARTAAVGTYREMYGVDPDEMSIGAAPSRDQDPVRHVAWHRAWEALGRPVEQADHQTLTDEQLRSQVERWEREQAWAPAYVAPELERDLTLAEEYRRDSTTRWAEVDAELTSTDGVVTEEVEQLVERAERADRMAERCAESAARFERLHEARQRWVEHTAEAAERARLAAQELERRGEAVVEGVPDAPQVEQLELFDERGQLDTEYARQVAAEAIEGELEPMADREVAAAAPEPLGEILDVEFVEETLPLVNVPDPVVESSSTELLRDSDLGELLPSEVDATREAGADVEVDALDAEIVECVEVEDQADGVEAADEVPVPQAEVDEAPVLGDHGTKYVLDDLAEVDASYPLVEDLDPDQLALFDVDVVARRVTAGEVRPDLELTVGEAEHRARLAQAQIEARERQAEREQERLVVAEAERRRQDREREHREEQLALQAEALRERADRSSERELYR